MADADKRRGLRRIFCVLGLLLIAVFAAGGFQPAFAADAGVLTYDTLDGNNVVITDCAEDATNELVEAAFAEIAADYNTVTSIGDRAFSGCARLTYIDIPDGVTGIGDRAFSGCAGLTSIVIPDGVTDIGDGAFFGCGGLTSIVIPDGVTSIGDSAFQYCAGLTSIVIPDGVTSIGSSAFDGCGGLTNIVIPDGVTSIGNQAFRRCARLTNIVIPDGVTGIDDYAFYGCAGLTSIVIPDGVTSIGDWAFYGCEGLTSIVIPDGVTGIGDSAFSACAGLTSIDIPDSLTSIGNQAFYGCAGLTSIVIPGGVTSIGAGPFAYCRALTAITVDLANTYFMSDAYGILFDKAQTALIQCPAGSGLAAYAVPDRVTGIGDYAFDECAGLTSIDIPACVTSIGERAFYKCAGLTAIAIPDGVTSIGNRAFSYSGIEEISVPASVTDFGTLSYGSFSNMPQLRAIVFDHGRTDIPSNALSGTFPNPTEVYVPMSVTSVDANAFDSPPDANLTICGVEKSYIETWARGNNVPFKSINAWITKNDYENAWRLVPYQYIVETSTQDNAGLSFEVVGGGLPRGLSLLPDGQFHGAPLETGSFTFHVAVRFNRFGESDEYLMDLQEIKLRVEEPGDAQLAATNDYKVFDFIGEPAIPGTDGNYTLRGDRAPGGLADQIFEAADGPEDIAAGLSNYRYFVDFWLDGNRLTRNADYAARGGSTVVTVYAKTFQNLDNGPHTVAAEFLIADPAGGPAVREIAVQKVSAQKFTLELTGEKTPNTGAAGGNGSSGDGGSSGNGGSSGGNGSSGGYTPPAAPSAEPAAPDSAPEAAWQNPFGDVRESDWFYADVVYVCERGLMNGTSSAAFGPNAPMSRGMLVTVLHRAAGGPAPEAGRDAFSDVPASAYYADAAAWAAASGLLSGAGDGRAAPEAEITRQDLATLIARYADREAGPIPSLRSHAAFADETGIADYAREAVRTLAEGGVLNGKPGNLFDPSGKATRAEAAAVLHRFVEATDLAAQPGP